MSRKSTIRRKPQLDLSTERLHHLQQRAQEGVTLATERVGPAAHQARELAAERILLAREWSAPRLDLAAKYVESELGPRVGSFLSETARRVEPTKGTHKTRNTAALIGAAGAASVGVAGALAKRRKNAQESQHEHDSGAGFGADSGTDIGPGSTAPPSSPGSAGLP